MSVSNSTSTRPAKRKRANATDAAELMQLRKEMKEMRAMLKKVRRHKNFHTATFVNNRKRTPSPEGKRKMWDLVRSPTLRVFDRELAKKTTPLYSQAKIVDLTDDTERLATYATLNKPLFYKWAEPVVEEILGLFPRLEHHVPEIYDACMHIVRERRKNQKTKIKRKTKLHRLRFQTPSTKELQRQLTFEDSGDDSAAAQCAPAPVSPEQDSQALSSSAEEGGYTTPPRRPLAKNVYNHRFKNRKSGRPTMMFADNAHANLRAIDPCPRASSVANLVTPKPESASDRPAKLKPVKPESASTVTTRVEPVIDLSSYSSDDDDEISSFCANSLCGKVLSVSTSFPKPKPGREWSTPHVERRCKPCWLQHKAELMMGIKNKQKTNKQKTAKPVKPCDKCGRTDHKRAQCFLKKHSEVSVVYDDVWYDAVIEKVHRRGGGYFVRFDVDGCTSEHVHPDNIRPREEK